MNRNLYLAGAIALLAVGTGCPSGDKTCVTASDCAAGELCTNKVCVATGCPTTCTGNTPICDDTAKKCVACTSAKGCTEGKVCDTKAATPACVQCTGNTNCATSAPVCDLTVKKCVVCTEAAGCLASETCDTTVSGGNCVPNGCSSSADCASTPTTPVCDRTARKCVVCTGTEGCATGTTCDVTVSGGQCTGCTASSQCTGATPVCDPVSHKCVFCTTAEGCAAGKTCVNGSSCVDSGCNTSTDCASTPATPVCDTTTKKCVFCTATEGCALGKKCEGGTSCVDAGCTSNTECASTPATPVCDTVAKKCVVCTASAGCAAGSTCDVLAGQCVCTSSAGCAAPNPVCDTAAKKCVVCTATEGCNSPQVCDVAFPGGRCITTGCTKNDDCAGTSATPICDTTAKKCVACTETAGCTTGVCDLSVSGGQCVDCLDDNKCSGATPVCDTTAKKCVACNSSKGCTFPKVCDTTSAPVCVDCLTNASCSAPTPVCNTGTKKCVTCTQTEGCAASQVCDLTASGGAGACVGCLTSTDCKTPTTPVCNTTTKTCIVCSASEGCTSQGKVCDVSAASGAGACVGCLTNINCSGTKPICDTAAKTCVTCTAQSGCTPPQTCDLTVTGGVCKGCLADADCSTTPATPVCNASAQCVVCTSQRGCTLPKTCDVTVAGGRCVGCATNADCSSTPATPACNASAQCVVCTDTFGCSGTTPKCKTGASPVCVECLANGDCIGGKTCNTATNTCIASVDVSAQIAAARTAADSATLSLPITGALVTYVRAQHGTGDPAGFFIQGAQAGPALFVSDLTNATPAPVAGDRVSFTITKMATSATLRVAETISGYTRDSQGNSLAGLLQNLSSATDVVSAVGNYEAEYITISGTIGASAYGGNGFNKYPLTTEGIFLDPATLPNLRIPTTVANTLPLAAGCTVTMQKGIVWRFNADAQPSGYEAGDFSITNCPAPKVVPPGVATSATQVRVTFDRSMSAASITAGAFTISGLTVSAAALSATSDKAVELTTSAQTGGVSYTVTVAATVRDTLGKSVDPTANSAPFTGYTASMVVGPANGDMELWNAPPTLPSSWTAAAGCGVAQETTIKHGGNYSVKLTRNSSTNSQTEFASALTPVVPAAVYKISFWYYDNDATAAGNVSYAFYDATQAIIGTATYDQGRTADKTTWQEMTLAPTAPANAAFMKVMMRVYGTATGGFVYLDDVTITKQ